MTAIRTISILFTAFALTTINASAQDNLDYNGYHIVFKDDFRYPDPRGIYPSVAFQSDSIFMSKWEVELQSPCVGWGHERYNKSQVTMTKNGIIRLMVAKNTDTSCNNRRARSFGKIPVNYTSGMLSSKQPVHLGIIEARIKLPSGRGDTAAWPAFWMPWSDEPTNRTEIDIIDNASSNDSDIVTNIFFILQRDTDLVRYSGRTSKPFNQLLSDDYHIYSCILEPSRVSIYVDGKYLHHINYQDGQIYPSLHPILITLQTREQTKSGLTMDIDWIKYWEKDSGDELVISQEAIVAPKLHKHHTIKLSTKKKKKTITIDKDAATILEAKSTIISNNFVADESESKTKHVTLGNFKTFTAPSNGYLIIRPLVDTSKKSQPTH